MFSQRTTAWDLREKMNWTSFMIKNPLVVLSQVQNSPWMLRFTGNASCPPHWETTCFCAPPAKWNLCLYLAAMVLDAALTVALSTLLIVALFRLSIIAERISLRILRTCIVWRAKRQLHAERLAAQNGSRHGYGRGSQARCRKVGISLNFTGVKELLNYVVLTLIYLLKRGRGFLIGLRMTSTAPLKDLQEPQ